MKQLLVFCPSSANSFCGVADYTEHLVKHLSLWYKTSSLSSDIQWSDLWKSRKVSPLNEAEAILLQYVPQLYLKKESFWLVLWLFHFCIVRGKKLYVTVHEYAIPWSFSFKRIIGRLLMMWMMMGVGLIAESLIVTTGNRLTQLRRLLFWKKNRLHIIPVGSNVPKISKSSPSHELSVVLALFGHPSGIDSKILEELKHWASLQQSVHFVWIARSQQEIADAWFSATGFQAPLEIHSGIEPDELSRLLTRANVFVAPLIDGVSTRRSTIITALAHGLPVLGTDGECTDDILRNSPAFLLGKTKDAHTFIRNLETLIRDPQRRSIMSQAAQNLYAQSFRWELIAEQYQKIFSPEGLEPSIAFRAAVAK